MFQLNIFGNLSPLSIYLVRPNNEVLGSLDNIINRSTASLTVGLNKQYSLSFDIQHISGDLDWFDYVQEGMYLFVDGYGLFKIEQPSTTLDGVKEQKSVTAYSCDSELENSTCTLDINMGVETSMEYLVEYEDDETESIINPYTNVPYDWIVLYNTFPEQLEIESQKLSDGYYGTADDSGEITVSDNSLIEELTTLFSLIPRLKSNITYTDNEDGSQDSVLTEYVVTNKDEEDYETIVSYTLTSSYADRIQTLITFYTKYREQLSLLSIILENTGGSWTIGDIYGISDGDYTLANTKCQFEINETIYAFLTQSLSSFINCIVSFDIVNRHVNITPVDKVGDYTGIFMGYDTLINTLNIETDEDRLATRLLVSGGDDLDIARVNFGSNYIEDLSYKMNVKTDGDRIYVTDELAQKYDEYIAYREEQRENYIQLSKDYEAYAEEISEIENKLPNDYLYTDWSTYTLTELQTMLTNFKNLLVSLSSLYKEDYGDAGLNNDGSIDESYIRTTPYWWDYTSYNSIISQLECAIEVYPYYSDESKWTSAQVSEYEDAISSWETEWTLFGIVELRAKIETYKQNMDLLAEESVIRVSDDSYEIKTWDELTSSEQAEYGSSSALYKYDTYMEYYNYMVSAQEYLDELLAQVDSLGSLQEQAQSDRVDIVESVSFESYFTEDECEIIYRMLRDSEYSNANIIATSLDSSSETIDIMNDLLLDAQEQLSIVSRPQLIFSVDADNLLANPDMSALWSSFIPGNYMLIEYKDGTYVRLRMTGYSFNPCIPSSNDLKVEFSNFIKSKSGYNDWASLLGTSSGVSSSSGGSSSSSSSGSSNSYNDNIDVTISSTMLSKLLNTELFGTRVTDIILDTLDVNTLTAKSAKFGGLASGTTSIDGKCIKTGYIVDATYDGTDGDIDNTTGTVINLENGLFSFGGGKLMYDGDTLSVNGSITATDGTIGGFTISSTSNTGTTSSGGHVDTNSIYTHTYSSDNEYEYEVGLKKTTKPEAVAIYVGTIAVGDEWSNVSYNFAVKNNGTLVAKDAVITGEINASSGTIGGFEITSTSNTGSTSEGGHFAQDSIYIHTSNDGYEYESGIRGSDSAGAVAFYVRQITSGDDWNTGAHLFYVTNLGKLFASNAVISGSLTATSLSTGSRTSSSTGTDGIFINSSGTLYAGSNNEVIIWANGHINFGNGKLVYDGSTLTVKGAITASSGTIGGFTVTSTSSTGTTSNSGHFATNSLYVHTSDGTYEYEAGLKADSGSSGYTAFYVRRIPYGDSWDSSDGAYVFYVTNGGKLYSSNAQIKGSITATSFTAYGTDSGTYTTIGDNIRIVNTDSNSEPYIAVVDSEGGTTTIDAYSITIGSGGSIQYNGGNLEFSKQIDITAVNLTSGLRCGADTEGLVITTTSAGNVLFGAHNDYVSEHPQSHLRGGTVRIYNTSDSGGVYLGVSGSTAVTSDENFKDISDIDDKYTTFFSNIVPVAYKYKVGHRTHMGFSAQAIEQALIDSGLTTEDFAGVIKQTNVDIGEDERISADGATHFDELYSLRYEEFIPLNTLMIKKLQNEVYNLRQQIAEIQST